MSDKCYFYRSDSNTVNPFPADLKVYRCPSSITCCNVGTICLSNGICQVPGTPKDGYTGYFMSSCSDPTFSSPDCPKSCTALQNPDVVYNNVTKQWACCGWDFTLNKPLCDRPTVQVFSAPAPADLKILGPAMSTYTSLPSSSVSTLSAVSSGASITTSTTVNPAMASASLLNGSTNSSPQQTTGSTAHGVINVGTVAGIAIGTLVGSLAIIGLLVFLFRRYRKRSRTTLARQGKPHSYLENSDTSFASSMTDVPRSPDLRVVTANSTSTRRYEVDAMSSQRHEIDGVTTQRYEVDGVYSQRYEASTGRYK